MMMVVFIIVIGCYCRESARFRVEMRQRDTGNIIYTPFAGIHITGGL